MSKIHLIISSEPIPEGADIFALCGQLVRNSSATPLPDMEQPHSTLLFCKDCFGKNYFYALTTAQEAKDLETEA